MGTPQNKTGGSLADALFTTTQQRVLGQLFGRPGHTFYAREVISLTGGGSGAIQRELARLESSGLITSGRRGAQKHYQANKASPLFEELCSIVSKTVAVAEPLRRALAPFATQITAAFVYGSVANGQDTADSDIDLMIVSNTVGYPDVMNVLFEATHRLGREVNPTIYNARELETRRRERNAFVTRVLEQPKIWIIGSEGDLTSG